MKIYLLRAEAEFSPGTVESRRPHQAPRETSRIGPGGSFDRAGLGGRIQKKTRVKRPELISVGRSGFGTEIIQFRIHNIF